jgi:hypothetical protein
MWLKAVEAAQLAYGPLSETYGLLGNRLAPHQEPSCQVAKGVLTGLSRLERCCSVTSAF